MQVISSWKPSVASLASLPAVSNATGDLRQALNTGVIYRWDGAEWVEFTTGGGGQITFDAVVAAADADYTTVGAAIAAGKTSIFVRDGVYAESTITMTTDNVTIVGESREGTVLRIGAGLDGFQVYANGSSITNLTIDGETNDAAAAYVVGDGSTAGTPVITKGCRNRLTNCTVKGGTTTFALFIAGASTSAGAQTLSYFNSNDLQIGNVVEDCYLYSPWNGDSFSFSLQRDGSFSRNRCFGGRIAFYMTRNSHCDGNVVSDPVAQGVFVGAPSWDNTISNNAVYSPASTGFKFQNQLEHTVTGRNFLRNTVSGNTVYDAGGTAFEVNDSEGNTFSGNSCANPQDHGFYLQEAVRNSFVGNSVTNPRTSGLNRGSGFYLVANCTDNAIDGNVITDDRGASFKMHAGIANREGGDCQRNVVTNNVIRGRNGERTVWIQSNGWIVSGNSVEGGNYAGIRLDGASDCVVTSNVFRNNTNDANNAYAEIWLQNSASRNVIEGNVAVSDAANKAANVVNVDGAGCAGNKVGFNIANGVLGALLSDTGTSTETIQTKQEKGVAGGYASLDGSGKIPTGQLPDVTITDTSVVASQAAMLALTAQTGDVAVRTDLNKTFILKGANPTVLADWQELLTPTDSVTSVNGQSGAVTIKTAMATFRYYFQNSGRTYSLPNNTIPSTFRFENTDAPSGLEFYVGTPTEGGFHFVDNRANNLSVAVKPAAL